MEVSGNGITPAPSITPPVASTFPTDYPTEFNGGTLTYNTGSDSWKFGASGSDVALPSQLALDNSFAFGTYGLTVLGNTFNLNLPSTAYPANTPMVTLTGGSWVGGKYVIDASHDLMITSNAFANFNRNADGAINLNIDDANINQLAFYSSNPAGDNFVNYTITHGTLTPGSDYYGGVGYYAVTDRAIVAGLPGSLLVAGAGSTTGFVISVVPTPTAGAKAHFYGVGILNPFQNGGSGNSSVRDATKTGGVIYAVGGAISYEGSPAADTGFVWTSTGGLTPLPYIVQPTSPITGNVVAVAITPNAAYIASRAFTDAAGGFYRHAVRVTTSAPTNLDLGTLPGFPQNSLANAISSDGSVLYGTARYNAGGKNQAVRFTASGPTVTAIPFLNPGTGDDNSSPAARATSSDGSVMVGTSSNSVTSSGNLYHTGNQAFRYVEGTGISAIPFLSGGTWNFGIQVSPDGNLALVFGNSTAYPNGELYIYNALAATTTSLGTPAGFFSAANIAGMNSDGSVVAIIFGNTSFIHNASGWHPLSTVLAGAGLNLVGWNINPGNGNGVFGMSADGTLLWGAGNHNGNNEGWVIEFNAGYLAAFGSAPHDFNGDGKSDLIWTNTSTGDRAMWLMNGGTMASGALLGNVPTDWKISGTGDFNGDGKADVVLSNTVTGDRAMWLMDGPTIVSNIYLGNVPTAWTISAVGDFNGDGKADLFWSNTVTGDRAMWVMNGGTQTAGAYLGVVPLEWKVSGTGDFNGDGKTDVVWTNTSTGERAVWLMNGGTLQSGDSLGVVPTAWTISGVGDFDGDGKADILLSNTSTGDRAMWLMNGPTINANIYLGNVPVAWTMTSVGDFDGDRKADLFWGNTVTGDRAMWLMNGGTQTAGAYLGVVPVEWVNPP